MELDEQENLQTCRINANALVCSSLPFDNEPYLTSHPRKRDTGFPINIITTASSGGTEDFVSRMFAPGYVPGDEDHVCGSAHCILGPYWSGKRAIPRGQEIKAKQVSPRGGDLKVVWEADRDVVRLMGELALLAKGELHLT